MILSAKLQRTRRARTCADCSTSIDVGAEYVRLFGRAELSDPPYAIALCSWCAAGNLSVRSALPLEHYGYLLILHPQRAASESPGSLA